MGELTAGEDIFADIEIGEDGELLVNDGDAMRRGVAWRANGDGRSVEEQGSGIGGLDPSEDPHQC